MKLLCTFLIIFLAIQAGTARDTLQKRGIWDFITGIIDGIKSLVKGAFDLYIGTIKIIAESTWKVFQIGFKNFSNAVGEIKGTIEEGISGFIDSFKSITDKAIKPIAEQFQKTITALFDRLQLVIDNLQATLEQSGTDLSNKVKEYVDSLSKQQEAEVQNVVDEMIKTAGEGGEQVKKCADTYTPQLKELLQNNADALKSFVDSINTKLQDQFKLAVEGINKAKGTVKSILEAGKACWSPDIKPKPSASEVIKCFGSASADATRKVNDLVTDLLGLGAESTKLSLSLLEELKDFGTKTLADSVSQANEILTNFNECSKQT